MQLVFFFTSIVMRYYLINQQNNYQDKHYEIAYISFYTLFKEKKRYFEHTDNMHVQQYI